MAAKVSANGNPKRQICRKQFLHAIFQIIQDLVGISVDQDVSQLLTFN